MKFKRIIKKVVRPESLIERILKYLYTLIKRPEYLQKRKKYGEKNADKTIYVIRPNTNDCIQGLMSLFVQAIRKIDYANKKGYISYIDYKNYKTQYYDGKSNAWNWFFTQPSDLKTDDVYNSQNVILSGVSLEKQDDFDLFKSTIFFDDCICEKCNKLIWNNISLSDEVNKIVERENKNINVDNCIGVYIRGTDYVKLQPSGEYVQPDINLVFEKVKEFLNKYKKCNIFLVTEDQNNYDFFKEKFGEKLKIVSFDNFINNYDGKNFLSQSNSLNDDKKKRGMDYLVKLVLLSKCKYFVSSITFGSIATYAMNGNKYEDKYIFNLGKYK